MAEEQLNDAIAGRLARLNTMPVDSSRLDAFLHQQIPQGVPRSRMRRLLRPMNAIAASLIGAVLIGVPILSLGDRSAVAAPAQIAQWHQEMIEGGGNVMPASTIDEANFMLATHDANAPRVQGVDESMGSMACCCVRRVGKSRISCVMMNSPAGGSVMVCVGDGDKIQIPSGESTVTRAGVTYHLMSQGAVNVVMSHRDGRWIACTGKVPHATLIDTAAGLKF